MKRYQLYLDPHSVAIIDELGQVSDISRSEWIRKAIDRFAEQVVQVFSVRQDDPNNYKNLDSLVGLIKIKGSKQTNYAENIDEYVYAKENL